jgi:hypothetical protein
MKKLLSFFFLLLCTCSVVNAQLSVFADNYAVGATFADFGGAINVLSVDNTTAHTGTSSLKALVPSSSYVGGAIKAAAPVNLSAYNSISFWVKASASKTLNVSGISNNGATATFQTEYINLPVSTAWTKYVIPIPAASKLTAEDGLFHFAEGSDEGAYTLWFDDIQYENNPMVGAFTSSFATQTITPLIGGTFSPGGLMASVLVNGVAQSMNVNAACFTFTSSNTSVATIVNGNGTAVASGTAIITGSLNGVASTGMLTVNVAGALTAPTVAAPTPTKPAANVISIFSNAYVDVPNTNWNPNWGQSTIVTDVQIAGNDTKKYANLNYQGIEFGTPAINASTMQFLHVDLWTPNCTAFEIVLINPGPVEQGVTVNPTAPGWNSFDIPLTSYSAIALNNIFQIKLVGTPFGSSLVYMDNLYFYKNAVIAAPLVGAPVPTALPANVLSVFSDTYTNIAGTDFFPNWGQSTVVSDVVIGGNNTKKYVTMNYQGIQFANPVNASTMQFLHVDLWTPNCTAFDVFLINPGPVEQAYTITPTLAGWNSIDIPLTAYNTIALNNIIQFKLVSTPFGSGTVYLDNIYFYKTPSLVPLVAAPVPTRAAPFVLSVYSDTYTNIPGTDFFPNWGQSTVVSDLPIAGNNTKKYATLNYQGVQFANPVDASTMQFLHVDLWTPNCTAFDLFLINPGPVEKAYTITPTTYGWNSIDIPLTAYNTIALNNIIQFKLVGTPFGTSTVYLDNIYFYKNPPTAPLTAAPTPVLPNVNVISLFSNTYTDLAGTDWFPNWGQSTVVSDVLIAGNATKKYDNLNYQGVQFANPVNAAAMQYLHMDLWTGNCTAFDVFLINTTPSTVEQKVTVTPTAYGWNSIDIPLTQYNMIALNNIGQFKLVGTPFGTSNLYLDNIYFYNTPAFAVSSTNLTIAAPANSVQNLTVTSNTSWNIVSSDSWLSIITPVGVGNATIIMSATENTSTTATRTATLTITGPGFPTKIVTVVQDKAALALSVAQTALTVGAAGSNALSTNLTSNISWTATSNQAWLTVDPASGNGNASLQMTASANTTFVSRTATVTVSAAGVPDQVITIVQDAAVPAVAVSATTLSIAAPANSTKSFDITANTTWTVTSSAAWLTANLASGSGNSAVVLTAQANPVPTTRTATVTITGLNVAPKTITVTQDAALPTLAVSATALTIAAPANSTKAFDVTSNTTWTAVSNATWLTLSSATGSANATITMTATENTTIVTRSTTVVVSTPGVADQTITVTQDAGAATLAVSSNALTIAAPANSTKTFDVTSNTSWTLVSSATWLTLSSATGTANQTITLTAQENTNPATRSATVVVSSAGLPDQTITVSQDAGSAALTVSTTTLAIAAPANSSKTFDIVSNTNWTVSSNATWLSASSTTGTANKTITLTAQANTAVTVRTTTVVVSAVGLPNQIITITQDAVPAVLTVSAKTLTIAAPANSSASFDITSNTSWTVATGQTWLSTNGSGGFGDGKIILTAQANPNTTTRSTTVTISAKNLPDQIVTVTQEAKAVVIVMTVSTPTLKIAAPANSTKTFDIASNTTWTVSSNQTWLAINTATGSNNATITLTAQANTTSAIRTATITVKGTGAADQTIVVTQDFVSGVNNLEEEKIAFAVYPNPTTDLLFLKLKYENAVSMIDNMTISDMTGKLMMRFETFDIQKSIDVSTLPSGVYVVKLIDNNTKAISTRKFVKQ